MFDSLFMKVHLNYVHALHVCFISNKLVDSMIREIRGSLDVNTKILLFRYMLFFSTKYGLFTSYTYRIGEKSVNILQKNYCFAMQV